MKAVELAPAFGMEYLQVVERPQPQPGPGQVLLKMKAVSLNFRDILMVKGMYNPKQPLPLIPCSDGVGEVVALGQGVKRFALGDRVCPIFAQGWLTGEPTRAKLKTTLGSPLNGTLTEYMVVDAQGAVAVPSHLSDAEAATLPCAAVTAWSALVTLNPIQAGDTVLLQGTGGVSIFALQFCKMMGARVIATSSSDAKLERVRAMGADETINYKEMPQWSKVIRTLTGGRGVDHIVEVGGAGTLEQSLRSIAVNGTISMIGVLAGAASQVDVRQILMKNIRIQGIIVGHRTSFEAMNRAIVQNKMKPIVDRVFPFAEVANAFEYMQSGKHFGKVCISFDGLST